MKPSGLVVRLRGILVVLFLSTAVMPSVAQDGFAVARERVDITVAPWNAVGQVSTTAYGRCTGILIGRQKTLTAAHCLFNQATGRFLPPSSVHFVLGYDRGDYAFQTVAHEIHMDPSQDGTRSLASVSRDWAVLVLADPAPATLAPMPVEYGEPEAGADLSAAGFGRDRAHALMACALESSLIAFVKLADWGLRTRRVHGSLRGRSRWTAACWRQMVGSTEVVLAFADGTAFSGTV